MKRGLRIPYSSIIEIRYDSSTTSLLLLVVVVETEGDVVIFLPLSLSTSTVVG